MPRAWLKRVQHDLTKPLLWAARDVVETGERDAVARAELGRAWLRLIDDEGQQITATALWATLAAAAPIAVSRSALTEFGAVLAAAEASARNPQASVDEMLTAMLKIDDALASLIEAKANA